MCEMECTLRSTMTLGKLHPLFCFIFSLIATVSLGSARGCGHRQMKHLSALMEFTEHPAQRIKTRLVPTYTSFSLADQITEAGAWLAQESQRQPPGGDTLAKTRTVFFLKMGELTRTEEHFNQRKRNCEIIIVSGVEDGEKKK